MTTDVVGAYDESRPKVPILCFVSGSGDPLQNIASLCELKLENRNRVKSFFLGRGMVKIPDILHFLDFILTFMFF